MKKNQITRYNLDNVYSLQDYHLAVGYAMQNINVGGVREQLSSLQSEKERYCNEVSALVESERNNEQQRYKSYESWSKMHITFKWVFLGAFAGIIFLAFFGNKLPIHGELWVVIDIILALIFIGGGVAFGITFIGEKYARKRYQQYVNKISSRFQSMGSAFTGSVKYYNDAIDSLYLASLDSSIRETVLLRRDLAKRDERQLQAERENQRLQKQLIREQQRARATSEELLAIERKREAEKEALRRKW